MRSVVNIKSHAHTFLCIIVLFSVDSPGQKHPAEIDAVAKCRRSGTGCKGKPLGRRHDNCSTIVVSARFPFPAISWTGAIIYFHKANRPAVTTIVHLPSAPLPVYHIHGAVTEVAVFTAFRNNVPCASSYQRRLSSGWKIVVTWLRAPTNQLNQPATLLRRRASKVDTKRRRTV